MSEPEGGAGDLAIVLHAHMPYVEGFGTYPFGEEWLFDAVIRSHLPVLEVARAVTLTVTPVLADQLEAPGVNGRLREFLVEHRLGAAERDIESAEPAYRAAAQAEYDRYRRALRLLDQHGGDPLNAFREAGDTGRVALAASSATHAVLPLLATRDGVELQVETGVRSHRRRFGWNGGFWLPECAYVPGLEWDLARSGVEWFCVDQSRHEPAGRALTPVLTGAGPVAFPIDWEAISWLWDMRGYPSWTGYLDFHRLSMNGIRIFRIDGEPYDAAAAAETASRQADEFLDAVAGRLVRHRDREGERGLLVFAVDCELLGHWWSEGPLWLAQVLERAAARGVRLVTLDEAARAGGRSAELEPSTWGEDKDFRTWDDPAVADLASGSRNLELAVRRAVAGGLRGDAAERAVRELLAVQSSDWAFLDNRKQAGDYPFERAIRHAEAAFDALQSGADGNHVPPDSRVRSLAPDLSLAPLLTP
jgi:1,4-alpha-glucan branching enzyme